MQLFNVRRGARRLAAIAVATGLAGLILAAGGPAAQAQVQVIVVQSNASGLDAGQLLDGNAKVSIPAGKQAVFVLPSGATRTVTGPFKGTAAGLAKGASRRSDVFDVVKDYVVTGGTTTGRVGAMRSAMPASFNASVPFSWQLVPLTASGDVCLLKGSKIKLARSNGGKATTLTVVDMKQNRRAQRTFPANTTTIPWPDEVELDAGGTYALLVANRNPRQIRVRLISETPSAEETLLVLHRERCQSQFRAKLRELQQAKK